MSETQELKMTPEIGMVLRAKSQHEQQDKVRRFKRLNKLVRKGEVLFVGSSLMEQFPIAEFQQDYDLPCVIYNRGIGGYTTMDMAENLEAMVFELEPRAIFINIGTNDMNGPDYSEEGLMGRYEAILASIKERLPETKLFLMAYYPVNPDVCDNEYMAQVFQHRTNERVRSANRAVERLAEKMGATFLDCNAGITDEEGRLKAEYTIEGMHMYANGYVPVLEALLPVLETL